MKLKTATAEETIQLGSIIGTMLQAGDVIALQGTLAAGKTQLTKGIAQGLGIEEPVTSPTFTLISEYHGRLPLYHMDVYRLGSAEEFSDLGIEEMLYGDGVCVIEWSEKVMQELPERTILIAITAGQDSQRTIGISNWPYPSDNFAAFEEA